MAIDATKVIIGAPNQKTTGAIKCGPVGTELPTDSSTALDAAFLDGGYVSDSGVEFDGKFSTNDIVDWNGDTVRSLVKSAECSVSWDSIQMDERDIKNTFGDDHVTVTAATTTKGTEYAVHVDSKLPAARSWVIDMADGSAIARIVIPNGQNIPDIKMSFKSSDVIKFPVALTCYPDSAGNKVYFYLNDGTVKTA